MNEQSPVAVELSPTERKLLVEGLRQWGGPAHPTDTVAKAMGFENTAALLADRKRLVDSILAEAAMPPADWARALIATEFSFASDYYGAGVEWPTVAGLGDDETIANLRLVQRKLVGIARLP